MNVDPINTNYKEEDSIDIIALLKKVWRERILIIKTSISFFFIGCLVALLSPVVYTSQTTFVPQTSEDSSNSQGYAQLASLAGINLNTESSSSLDNYISPLLYSKIIESDEFSLSLINEELILLNGDKIKIKDYLLLGSNKFSIVAFIKKYTIIF